MAVLDTSIFKPIGTLVVPRTGPDYDPYVSVDDLKDVIDMTLQHLASEDRVPTPLGFAQDLHKHLVLCTHRSDDEDILYDFDEHYKLKFNINEVPYYFETWRTWQGALNWKIEEDLA